MKISQPTVRNRLLYAMKADDYLRLQPHLIRLSLPLRLTLYEAGEIIDWVYFPEDGVISVVSNEPRGKQIEIGIFGREGMSGPAAVLGSDRSPHEAYMAIAGTSGLRLATPILKQAMRDSLALSDLLLRYIQTTTVQAAGSTAAAAGYMIEQRLARWLLMCHDRMGGDELHLTQDFMSKMLGSRRSSVTEALHALEGQHLIISKRHSVTIRNRPGLEQAAEGSYGFAEAEYKRLMGIPLSRSDLQTDPERDASPALAATG